MIALARLVRLTGKLNGSPVFSTDVELEENSDAAIEAFAPTEKTIGGLDRLN